MHSHGARASARVVAHAQQMRTDLILLVKVHDLIGNFSTENHGTLQNGHNLGIPQPRFVLFFNPSRRLTLTVF